jgi:CO dehydrogenase/acetyl-CoA synthase gamma subunit (corrinoid Fe-S protein)
MVPRSAMEKNNKEKELHAHLAKLPSVNCRACGYRACSEFAEAVLNKEKTLEDCVFLSREKIGDPV